MNKRILLAALVVVAALIAWIALRPPATAPDRAGPVVDVPAESQLATAPVTSPGAAPAPAQSTPPAEPAGATPPAPGAAPAPSAPDGRFAQVPATKGAEPEIESARNDVENIGLMLRDYRSVAGDNPVGSNAEIMKSIMGGNKKGAMLGPPTGQSLNGEGELVDRWGTPIFFHQISGTHMEIRSAGPDRKVWTSDDILGR